MTEVELDKVIMWRGGKTYGPGNVQVPEDLAIALKNSGLKLEVLISEPKPKKRSLKTDRPDIPDPAGKADETGETEKEDN